TDESARVMTVGTHGTTYGGNPLASAAAGKVLEHINTPEMLNGAKQRHDRSVERPNTINHRDGLSRDARGSGLLLGR
ncbi:aminotransferase class III-fold pyridoxal phosphate-dependent enzyme, partial [Escherichia coli]|uniref:aminotransferase class III-fold pyridoxal phosphate-dependent enzyme n=1 Tax=Escherichia coli TaxID=562 RepID=UPI002092D0B5